MLGQPLMQQQQQQQLILNPDEAFAKSIYDVSIFGDERDIVIARWNHLQALWGNGKAFYAKNLPPVEITPQNVWHYDFKHILQKRFFLPLVYLIWFFCFVFLCVCL